MSLSNVYKISAVSIPTSGVIPQIISQDLNPGLEPLLEGGSGTLDTEFGAISQQSPVLSFETTAVATALGLIGINGLAISATTTFYIAKIAAGGVITAGSAHYSLTLSKGIIIPRRLKAAHKPSASIQFDVYALSSSGTAAPITTNASVALPSIAAVSELFCLGPVTINSTLITGLQEVDFDPGIKEIVMGADGNAYPTYAGIINREPKVTFKTLDASFFHSLTAGASLAVTTWKMFLRSIASGGTRVADATASHLKISGTTGLFVPEKQGGQTRKEFESEYCLHPVSDGTNAIATIAASVAIA